jgi:hypothetical protein
MGMPGAKGSLTIDIPGDVQRHSLYTENECITITKAV